MNCKDIHDGFSAQNWVWRRARIIARVHFISPTIHYCTDRTTYPYTSFQLHIMHRFTENPRTSNTIKSFYNANFFRYIVGQKVTTRRMLLLILSSLVSECIKSRTNCLRCLEDDGCIFCLTDNLCYQEDSWEGRHCLNNETTRTDRCVKELGGDANKGVRYAIGFAVLSAAIITDVTVRICACRSRHKDEYTHL